MNLEKHHGDVRYLRSPHTPHIELLLVRESQIKWRGFQERYAVCGMVSSASDWSYRGEIRRIRDACTLLIEPGEAYAATALRKPVSFNALLIEPEYFSRTASELGITNAPHFRVAQVEDARLFAHLCRVCDAIERPRGALEQQTMLAAFLHLVLLRSERGPCLKASAGRGIEKAMAMLQERFAENLSLNELAAAAGLSRFHFIRAFRQRAGVTPHAYQLLVRIEKARALLAAGMTATHVAGIVGFSDQSHLTRHFRRALRVTPSQYARPTGLVLRPRSG